MLRWHNLEDLDATELLGARLLGTVVKRSRLRRGLSQQQLAWRVGVSQSLISRLETGRLKGLRYRTLARIAGAINLDDDLWVEGGPAAPKRRLPGQAS